MCAIPHAHHAYHPVRTPTRLLLAEADEIIGNVATRVVNRHQLAARLWHARLDLGAFARVAGGLLGKQLALAVEHVDAEEHVVWPHQAGHIVKGALGHDRAVDWDGKRQSWQPVTPDAVQPSQRVARDQLI